MSISAYSYRLETITVPALPPDYPEVGARTYARALARVLCQALDGVTWRAQIRAPYVPIRGLDDRQEIAVCVDHRRLVVVTQTVPAGTVRDLWSISVNGRRIPHHTYPRELASTPLAIARSVRNYVRRVPVDPCQSAGCDAAPTVTTARGWGLCDNCARRYVRTGY